MEKKAINSRVDAITKDMQPNAEVEQEFNFPTLGITVVAKTLQEALEKAKVFIKTDNI